MIGIHHVMLREPGGVIVSPPATGLSEHANASVAFVARNLARHRGLEIRVVRGPLPAGDTPGRYSHQVNHLDRTGFLAVGFGRNPRAYVYGYGLSGTYAVTEGLSVRHKLSSALRNGKPRFHADDVNAALAHPRPCVVLCVENEAFAPGRENETHRAMELVTWGLARTLLGLVRECAGKGTP